MTCAVAPPGGRHGLNAGRAGKKHWLRRYDGTSLTSDRTALCRAVARCDIRPGTCSSGARTRRRQTDRIIVNSILNRVRALTACG